MSATVESRELLTTDRVSAKVWVREADGIDRADFVKVFQRWIQKGEIGGLLIDVHDYSHVPNGPGVMLVAHEAHYRMDDTDGRLGLRYVRKRQLDGDWSERLRTVFRETFRAAQALEGEPEFQGALRFYTSEVSVRVEDRLVAPNSPETFARFEPIVRPVANAVFDDSTELAPDDTSGAAFGVRITGSGQESVAELLGRLDR